MSQSSLLCVTVTAPTTAELRQRRDAAVKEFHADLVELRLDSVRDPNVGAALEARRGPVIVTCRPVWEGGQFSGSETERRQLLEEALARGAEYVDIEARAGFGDVIAKARGRGIVLSMHDFEGVPADLDEQARAMRETGAEVVKIAVRVHRLSDCLRLLDLAACPGPPGGRVLIAMGEQGIVTRVLARRFGSAWTYAGDLGQIGQVSAARLVDQYRFRSLSASTHVYGLTGSPIGHSVSPAMHNAAIRAAGLDAVYLPFPAADPDDFVTFARALGVEGVSVTIPFKVSLAERVDDLDATARRVGAINTVRVVNGRWSGRNTDVAGFLRPLQDRGVALSGLRGSILGAGGSARAVAIALASKGLAVRVHARSRERAEAVATGVGGHVGPWPPAEGSWDLLVNCTPVGMHPRVDETPVPARLLTGRLVYDLVYNPQVTRLLRDAAEAGCETIGGLDMLVAQAGEQFHWWTGIQPEAGVMRAAALDRLSEFATDENHVV
jgi:3-dehydroquinate dehydratase / shikimate dehydrogenase